MGCLLLKIKKGNKDYVYIFCIKIGVIEGVFYDAILGS